MLVDTSFINDRTYYSIKMLNRQGNTRLSILEIQGSMNKQKQPSVTCWKKWTIEYNQWRIFHWLQMTDNFYLMFPLATFRFFLLQNKPIHRSSAVPKNK